MSTSPQRARWAATSGAWAGLTSGESWWTVAPQRRGTGPSTTVTIPSSRDTSCQSHPGNVAKTSQLGRSVSQVFVARWPRTAAPGRPSPSVQLSDEPPLDDRGSTCRSARGRRPPSGHWRHRTVRQSPLASSARSSSPAGTRPRSRAAPAGPVASQTAGSAADEHHSASAASLTPSSNAGRQVRSGRQADDRINKTPPGKTTLRTRDDDGPELD